MKWTIEFSQEAQNYALDSHPYNEAVLIEIERLAETNDGFPETGSFEIMENWCVWVIADHIVVYELEQFNLGIVVTVIKPIG